MRERLDAIAVGRRFDTGAGGTVMVGGVAPCPVSGHRNCASEKFRGHVGGTADLAPS